MGGRGSGGWNRLSDEEKKARGTFRPDQSDDVYNARKASNVITGIFLSKIPEPDFPLTPIGRGKYNEWTQALFEQKKLTSIAVTKASAVALLFQKIQKRAAEGKDVSASDQAKFQSGLRDLDIAQHAQVIAEPGKDRFEHVGFADKVSSPIRLRRHSAADPVEL